MGTACCGICWRCGSVVEPGGSRSGLERPVGAVDGAALGGIQGAGGGDTRRSAGSSDARVRELEQELSTAERRLSDANAELQEVAAGDAELSAAIEKSLQEADARVRELE